MDAPTQLESMPIPAEIGGLIEMDIDAPDEVELHLPEGLDQSYLMARLEEGEVGDAALYKRMFRKRFVFDASDGTEYKYVGPNWEPDTRRECLAAMLEVRDVYAQLLRSLALSMDGRSMIDRRINKLNTLSYQEHVLKLSRIGADGLTVAGNTWDAHMHLLACANGVIDLHTGELREARPEMFLRRKVQFRYNPKATCPAFQKFLESIFAYVQPEPTRPELEELEPEDCHEENPLGEGFVLGDEAEREASRLAEVRRRNKGREERNERRMAEHEQALAEHAAMALRYTSELVAFWQRLKGYALLGDPKEHVFVLLVGENGSNGKSTSVELETFIFKNAGAIVVAPELLMKSASVKSSGQASPELVQLMAERMVTASESDQGQRFDAGVIKRLSGGNTISARPLYGKQVTFELTFTIFLETNFAPVPPGNDPAFWRRIVYIPFNVEFVDEPTKPHQRKKDRNLLAKLKDEAEGILAWYVQGALEYQRTGLRTPDFLKREAQEYREEMDIYKQFITECCLVEEKAESPASTLFDAFKQWCDRYRYSPGSNGTFKQAMIRRGYAYKARNNGRFYLGLEVMPGGDEDMGSRTSGRRG